MELLSPEGAPRAGQTGASLDWPPNWGWPFPFPRLSPQPALLLLLSATYFQLWADFGKFFHVLYYVVIIVIFIRDFIQGGDETLSKLPIAELLKQGWGH